jgi:hypothetical protein
VNLTNFIIFFLQSAYREILQTVNISAQCHRQAGGGIFVDLSPKYNEKGKNNAANAIRFFKIA